MLLNAFTRATESATVLGKVDADEVVVTVGTKYMSDQLLVFPPPTPLPKVPREFPELCRFAPVVNITK